MLHIVTGGAGFLGSHLVDRLIKNKEFVICIDDLSTGNKKNISHYFNNKYFKFINHDVIDPINLKADKIWHLACPASPIQYQKNPIKTAKTSFLGTYNMLNLALKNNARILFASTSEVYGDPEVHPQKENYNGSVNPIGIRSCYDEGKRIAETLCFDFLREYKTNVCVARIFNTYGPRMAVNDGRVVSNFICQSLLENEITIYGEGLQTRSFCYVEDLIEGFIKIMDSGETGPFNIGNPDEFSIKELASQIKNKVKSKSKIIHKKLPQDDPKQRKPDITKAREILNWSPEVKLDLGLDLTIKYFKELISDL